MSASVQLRRLSDELRTNPRLQIGAVVIVVLVLGWVYLVLGDWRAAKYAELEQAHERLSQVRSLAGQTEWVERAASASAVAATLSAAIPDTGSPGLAQAEFQGWLRNLIGPQADVLRLDMQPPVLLERPDGVVRVSATISGGLSPARTVQLINRIEGRTALTTIPVLTIRSDGNNQSVSLTVNSFYRLASAGAAQ